MKRKLLALLLASTLILSLSACNSGKDGKGDNPKGGKDPIVTQEPGIDSTNTPKDKDVENDQVSVPDTLSAKETAQKTDGSTLGLASIDTFNTQAIIDSGIFNTDNLDSIIEAIKEAIDEDEDGLEFRGEIQTVYPDEWWDEVDDFKEYKLDAIGYVSDTSYVFYKDSSRYIAVDETNNSEHPEIIRIHTDSSVDIFEALSSILSPMAASAIANEDETVTLFNGIEYNLNCDDETLEFQLLSKPVVKANQITLPAIVEYKNYLVKNDKTISLEPNFEDIALKIIVDTEPFKIESTANGKLVGISEYESFKVRTYELEDGEVTPETSTIVDFTAGYTQPDKEHEENVVTANIEWLEDDYYFDQSNSIKINYPMEPVQDSSDALNAMVELIASGISEFTGIPKESILDTQSWIGNGFDMPNDEWDNSNEAYNTLSSVYDSINDEYRLGHSNRLTGYMQASEGYNRLGSAGILVDYDYYTRDLRLSLEYQFNDYLN